MAHGPNRSCGKCSACCITLAVESIDKPDFEQCPHVSNSGCDIYARRPVECQEYRCLWLQGELSARELRPDRVGVVFTAGISPQLGGLVLLTELWDKAVEKDTIQAVVNMLGQSFMVLHVTKTRRVVLGGPTEQIRRIVQKLDRRRL
jgi:hypothetical protein